MMSCYSYKLRNITIKDYKGFNDIDIDCTRPDGSVNQWTILLGENNSGKTRILKAIAEFLLERQSQNEKNASVVVPRVYGYGVTRYPSSGQNIKGILVGDCATLLSANEKLVDLEDFILQISFGDKNGDKNAHKILSLFQNVICKSELFPEIHGIKVESDFTSDSLVSNKVLFNTEDGWYSFSELGFGYQSMLSWVVDLCYRLSKRYPDSSNPLHEPAIVLIDEIDLHLHPRWQRVIVPLLSEAFPKVQFIATTHSPFVIQSMENVNLYVLNRDNGKIGLSRNDVKDFRGWSVEEILMDVMKLEEKIKSDYLNLKLDEYDDSIDNDDSEKIESLYTELCRLLPPNSITRKIINLQKIKVG